MRIGIATDHGGFALKQLLAGRLQTAGHEVTDFGAHQLNPDDDYPDFVIPLGRAVAAGKVDRGVAVCGSGVGATVCANKIKGVRACLIEDHFSARQGVEDDVVMNHMRYANIVADENKIVQQSNRPETEGNFGIMARPPFRCERGCKCN